MSRPQPPAPTLTRPSLAAFAHNIDRQARFNPEYKRTLLAMYEKPRTKYLVLVHWWIQQPGIKDILRERYRLVSKTYEDGLDADVYVYESK
ncbi:hypothetical protein [Bifidobacterium leontopitheci]|uniref:hypothetical protein n=1 Tax=Bifidobacterium leontopitheci TaxID=2650774 RepID=UPI0012657F48|nr:hypothetical protein [Bifidobacterium leontopitheci]